MNNIKPILVILLALVNLFTRAQDFYHRQDSVFRFIGSVTEQTLTGNLALLTNHSIGNSPFVNTTQILTLDNQGNVVDSISFGNNLMYTAGLVAAGKHYFLLSYSYNSTTNPMYYSYMQLHKLDSNFHIVNTLTLDSSMNTFYMAPKLLLKGKDLYFGYYHQNLSPQRIKVYRADQNLNIKDTSSVFGYSLADIESYGQQVIFSYLSYQGPGQNNHLKVIEKDSSLSTVSNFQLDSLMYLPLCGANLPLDASVVNLTMLDNNHYMVNGNVSYFEGPLCTGKTKIISAIVSNNNQVQSSFVSGLNGLNSRYVTKSTSVSGRGSFYTIARIDSVFLPPGLAKYATNSLLFQKYNSSGSVLWSRYYGGDKYYLPTGVNVAADGGAFFYGVRYDSANPKVTDITEAFIIKLDKDGNQVFTQLLENGRLKEQQANCYPNPAQNEIRFELQLHESFELIVTDSFGKLVKRYAKFENLSALNISELTPGCYFYHIKTKTKQYSGKFVKMG